MSRLRRRAVRQDGFALIVALGFMFVLGIASTTAISYATTNESSTKRSKAEYVAQQLAEAALARAYATLYNSPDPTWSDSVPLTTFAANGGTGTYSGTLVATTWTLVGVGRVKSPTHGADIVRTVRGRSGIGSGQRGNGNNAVWNYIFVDDSSGCTTLGNSVNISIPLYVRGNLCLQQTATLSASAYSVQVGGYVQFENSSSIGGSGAGQRLNEAHIAGGCRVGTTGPFTTCGDATRVFTVNPPDTTTTGLTKPPVNLPNWYAESRPGPMNNCTSGSFPGGFDTDTTLNRSRGTVDLTPDAAYNCEFRDAEGRLVGQIKWEPGAPGTLTVRGTIFFDGDIVFRNSTNAVYVGRSTIYASGKITMNQLTKLCGVATCDGAWRPLTNLLAFVAGSSTDSIGFDMGQSTLFQGAVYAVNDYREANSSTVWGPIVARQVYFQNSTVNIYVPIGTLLPGMPAEFEEVVVVTNEAASWG